MANEITGGNKVYTCPMHPEVQSDQPGTCPKCGMDLVEHVKHKETKNRKSGFKFLSDYYQQKNFLSHFLFLILRVARS